MSQKILLAQQGFSLAYLIKPMSPCLHHMAYIIIKNYLLSKAFNDRPYKVHEPKFLLVHQASNNRPFNECEPKMACSPSYLVCLPHHDDITKLT
ncbi:hypothetical protein TIFTF001_047025 [Ficus carica]|uniref:Uncharacterized protein n=1 Tax=Ficus carica TaxID=3494 RepID=A0AA87Z8I3_FICCA|nr:hypothetical protein TIFTF001_047025 [Ficus carica]